MRSARNHLAPRLVVSIHDVSPATADQTARWCADADALGVPVSLLVIPGRWRGDSLADTPDYADTLRVRAARGDEIMLHGWLHQAGPEGGRVRRAVGQVVARGAAEFAALDQAQAAERLANAGEIFRSVGLSAQGFTPPGWLASPGSVKALSAAGFEYLTTHRGLWSLPQHRLSPGFALSHRPSGGFSERTGAKMMLAGARRGAARGRLVRVALHPDDLGRPGLRDTTLRAIEDVLRAGGVAQTYATLHATQSAARVDA
jgi:predicted deacetylase